MKTLKLHAVAVACALCCGTGFVRAQDTRDADKKFIADTAQDNMAEVNYAKLALQKSQDKNVRDFATKMISDHEMLAANMKPLAMKLGVKMPSGPEVMDHVKYDELKMKSGSSFDHAYVEAMVKDHRDDLQKMIDEENKTTNPELKLVVAKAEKVIRQHAEMIDNIAHMGGIQTPPLPGM